MMKQVITVTAIICALVCLAGAADLEKGFITPPDSAKPHTWWHWMNGNITKEGITADLEAMRRVGIGGAQIFSVGCGINPGPVNFMTPEWREMMKHAAKEADRVGVELCLHNCAGWSSSGGPWNTPENAMQQIVTSETSIKGPAHFSGALPQPPTKLDCYRDIEVLAFPTPDGEDVTMQALSPRVTSSVPNFSGAGLIDGKTDKSAVLPLPSAGKTPFIQFEFPQPFTARSCLVTLGADARSSRGAVQVSDDGQNFKDVQPFSFPRNGGSDTASISLGTDPAPAKFYRVKFTAGGLNAKQINVAEVSFSSCLRTDDVYAKSGMNMGYLNRTPPPAEASVLPGLAVNRKEIINLTGQMKPDGQLDWDVPTGQWTILRIGYTPTGRENHPAPEGGLGLECDKLSAEALDAHWNGFVQKVVDDLGPLAGKGKAFNNVLIDSYEVGGQNWTPKFREEFQQRRGYDPLPWLVTVTGRVVDNPDVSERFLGDMRRTIADLFAEKYYGRFKELCNQRGLMASIEPYNGPYESLQSGKPADIPMGEFWVGQKPHFSVKLAATVGHIYGKPIIGAESFTAAPSKEHGRWLDDPYAFKAAGDLAFSLGINRYIFHRYALQPWTNRIPGMTMGQWGSHFDRTCTWWEQGSAWMKYIARSQFMLQQGLFVADAAAFCGETAPVQMPEINPALPPGYDYDGINADVLLNQASVKDGVLTLKSGMRYRVLSLFPQNRTMTPQLLRKLRGFVADGLTLVGPPPEKSPGLAGYPKYDAEVKALVAELWGDCDGKTITEHPFGKGRIFWGQTMAQVFASLKVSPDFSFTTNNGSQLVYIHRLDGAADIYFVANQRDQFDSADCTFRVSGKVPEFWYPDTGRIEPAPVWREENGRITVPLNFDPAGSVFVVFRKKADSGDHIVSAAFPSPLKSDTLQIQRARYETLDGTQGADVTAVLAGKVHGGAIKITVDKKSLGIDPMIGRKKQLRVEYILNGQPAEKIIPENAAFEAGRPAVAADTELKIQSARYESLDGKQGADVTTLLTGQIRDNQLKIKVDNKTLGGDPALNQKKQLRVKYTLNGRPVENIAAENSVFEPVLLIAVSEPDLKLSADISGQVKLCAAAPGTAELKTASGKIMKMEALDVPKPVELSGLWELRFQPNRGAPAQVSLPKLISWAEHADSGVKYFSGTATYVKEVDIPAEMIGTGHSLWLNLGQVKNLAEVSVNGKPLGILWKPPFRVNITGAAKLGKNKLEIKVTNLWPNRLIGDEQLPEDCEWGSNLTLKQWPQWLLDGKPSPTGRLTFTTWHHWKKDEALLPSGLLGPVTLNTVTEVDVKP